MRYGVRVTLVSSLLLAVGAGCAPIEGDYDDDPYYGPVPLSGYGGAAGKGGSAGKGGAAGAGGAGGQGGGASVDLLERLRAVEGVNDLVELDPDTPNARSISFTIEQPVDHGRPELGTFAQRVFLLHRDEAAPTVLESTGYQLFWPVPGDSEPSVLLLGNSITIEHRFFGDSTPMRGGSGEPPDEAWAYLTIEQAAADHHRLIEALKPLYTGVWLSTGASKGGMTSIYHRRFYPGDIDGTVAYVAPHSFGTDDQRYVAFLEQVGDAACRDRIVALQRDVLSRRDETLPLFMAKAAERGLTFEAVGNEAAFEHFVQEFRFAFWQYGRAEECEALPPPGAPAAEAFEGMAGHLSVSLASDQAIGSVDAFAAYYYQAATQLGSYGPLELHLEDLLHFPRSYTVENYSPVPGPGFDPSAMLDVGAWVASEGEHILFIYGENDPWSAGAFATGAGLDVHTLVEPGGNHGSFLTGGRMPAESVAKAFEVLHSWTGVAPNSGPSVDPARLAAPSFHRPPPGLPL